MRAPLANRHFGLRGFAVVALSGALACGRGGPVGGRAPGTGGEVQGATGPKSWPTTKAGPDASRLMANLPDCRTRWGNTTKDVVLSVKSSAQVGLDAKGQPTFDVPHFSWLVELDTTKHHVPGTPAIAGADLAVSMHSSYMPLVASGCSTAVAVARGCQGAIKFRNAVTLPHCAPDGSYAWYYVSVLPRMIDTLATPSTNGGYTLSGATIGQIVDPGNPVATPPVPPTVGDLPSGVEIAVAPEPLQTGSLSVLVYEDNNPINNEPEVPEEKPLQGFSVILQDNAGTYGYSGLITQDAFGQPLGTTYKMDNSGKPILDASGNATVDVRGRGYLVTNDHGEAVFQNLPVGKWSPQILGPTCDARPRCAHPTAADNPNLVCTSSADCPLDSKSTTGARLACNARPPPCDNQAWHQTSTIEGTRTNDAWIKANEPSVFVEFGPPGHHVFVGFVHQFNNLTAAKTVAGSTVSGQVVNMHTARPPDYAFYSGQPITGAWIGVNSTNLAANPRGLYASPADPVTGQFTIPNVPPGSYQLVIWDNNLDLIWQSYNFTVPATGAEVALGKVPAFKWFHNLDAFGFFDDEGTGYRDPTATKTTFTCSVTTSQACGPTKACPAGESCVPRYKETVEDLVINQRFRDGSIYQSGKTDPTGLAHFEETFPFFNWMTLETDSARYAPTGLTTYVDDGGPVNMSDPYSFGRLNPQLQPTPGSPLAKWRTERGPSTIQAYQGFISQTNRIELGVRAWAPSSVDPVTGLVTQGENGGISGVVSYDTTRAEDDPTYGVAEVWQPGIPRVQVNLYRYNPHPLSKNHILALNGVLLGQPIPATPPPDPYPATGVTGGWCVQTANEPCDGLLADTDNWPFGWSAGGPGATPGLEDVKRAIYFPFSPTAWSKGDAVDVTWTTSWDDQKPAGCVWTDSNGIPTTPYSLNGVATDCFDGIRNFNQVRPGVYDGFYSFGAINPRLNPNLQPDINDAKGLRRPANQSVSTIPAGQYVVEEATPPNYLRVREESRNIMFGDSWLPQGPQLVQPAKLPPTCVGDLHDVARYYDLFPGLQKTPFETGLYNPQTNATNGQRAFCDRRLISVNEGENAKVSFFLYTEVPVAAHAVGIILDDLTNEFDVFAPTFGEKYGPPFVPISFHDWQGHEIGRTYSDEYGAYNALLPSMFDVNPPVPSGVGPNIVTACINSPGPIPNPSYDPNKPGSTAMIVDPWFHREYSQFCYELQFMPGKTTYLDTPVIPLAAFSGPNQSTLDCEQINGTPMIYEVFTAANHGPWVPATGTPVNIISMGQVQVPNPQYITPLDPKGRPRTIARDYGFGAFRAGDQVYVTYADPVTGAGVKVDMTPAASAWSDGLITATIPTAIPASISRVQLHVARVDANGAAVEAPAGITVHIGGKPPVEVPPQTAAQPNPISDTIAAAMPGDLILVPPGSYSELVIMAKPVFLQGAGAGSTVINAAKRPSETIANWRKKVDSIVAPTVGLPGDFLLPGQPNNIPPAGDFVTFVEPLLLSTEEGPGILVLGQRCASPYVVGGASCPAMPYGPWQPKGAAAAIPENARIDGLTVTGGDSGGAIFVNGYAHGLAISNNRITANQGYYGGGIRVGHPQLVAERNNTLHYLDGRNDRIRIEHNMVVENGGLAGSGAGISLNHGTDGYRVTDNFICGNFNVGSGGGIGHYGRNNNGLIARNKILFNQTFDQSTSPNGGGISIQGAPGAAPGSVSPGTGSVTIDRNLILGNEAGAGEGAGIFASSVNGADICPAATGACVSDRTKWNTLRIFNNIIADNVAGAAGGGISLQDVEVSLIVQNTIADNDSTATAGSTFQAGSGNQSTAQIAGLVSHPHSPLLNAWLTRAVGPLHSSFSSPLLMNDILRNSRSFFFSAIGATGGGIPTYGLIAGSSVANPDFGVANGTAGMILLPISTLATASADPRLIDEYRNGSSHMVSFTEAITAMSVQPAFDEGGNYIDARFAPITIADPVTNCVGGTVGCANTSPVVRSWADAACTSSAAGCNALGQLYHPRKTGSAYGTGAPLLSPLGGYLDPALAFDFDGNPRPGIAPDIGAAQATVP